MDIGSLFSKSWEKFSANIGMAIGIYLVGGIAAGFLSGITLGIAGIPIMAGMHKAFRKIKNGETPEFGDLFDEFSNFAKWFKLWVVLLVVGLIVSVVYFILTITVVGMVLLPFVGIALGIFMYFTIPLMIDKDMDAKEALMASIDKIKGGFGTWFLPILLVMIVSGVFAIITAPLAMVASWYIYDEAFGDEAPEPAPE